MLYHLAQNMEYMYRMDNMFQQESTTCLKPSKKKPGRKESAAKNFPLDPHPEVADQTNFSQQQACVFSAHHSDSKLSWRSFKTGPNGHCWAEKKTWLESSQ